MKITPLIAELVGLHIGDGTLYLSGKTIVWELRGGLDEKEFYNNHIKELLLKIFKINFNPKFRSGGKNGSYGFQISKSFLTHKFIDLGFKTGKKSHTVRIDSYIFEETSSIKKSYIKGLFDTDGCFRYKNGKNKPYPKVEFTSASIGLILDLKSLLESLKFNPNIWGSKYYKLCISGKLEVKRFLKEIRPANPKHLKRVHSYFSKCDAAVA